MRKILTAVVAFLLLSFAFVAPAAAATSPVSTGTVRVTINAPDGIAADVELTGATTEWAEKPRDGTQVTVSLPVPVGAYSVTLPRTERNGTAYVGKASVPAVGVSPGRTADLTVTYAQEDGATGLHAVTVGSDSVSMGWTAAPGSTTFLRRTSGTTKPVTQWQGVAVPVNGTTAVDRGLQAGGQYSYSLFTLDRTGLHGPLSLTVGTKPPAGSSQAAYSEDEDGELLTPADIVSTTPDGNGGVSVRLAGRTTTPVLGDGMVLPMSSNLPDGFLGVVKSVSLDGQTVDLIAGGLGDAFDHYDLSTNFSTPGTAAPAAAPLAAPLAAPQAAPLAAGNVCQTESQKPQFDFKPDVKFSDSRISAQVDKWRLFGTIPTAASMDLDLKATVTGAATLDASGKVTCTLPLPPLNYQISVVPVPLKVEFQPVATFTAGGAVKVENLGVTTTAGVRITGGVGEGSQPFKAVPTLNITPLTPKVTGHATVTAKIGGELSLGAGLDAKLVNVLAGVRGSLYPVDATFSLDTGCASADVQFTRAVGLHLKALVGGFSLVDEALPIEALSGSSKYDGSPWTFPTGCTPASADPPTDQPTDQPTDGAAPEHTEALTTNTSH